MNRKPPPGTVKNQCRICDMTVGEKGGVQCKGACARWAHYKCLGFTPQMILDARDGKMDIICPCPHCNLKKLDEQLNRQWPCKPVDGNCPTGMEEEEPMLPKPSMCKPRDGAQWPIEECSKETCFPPCRAARHAIDEKQAHDVTNKHEMDRRPSNIYTGVKTPTGNQNVHFPDPPPKAPTPVPKAKIPQAVVQTGGIFGRFVPETFSHPPHSQKVTQQTSTGHCGPFVQCGPTTPCGGKGPCPSTEPCGPHTTCKRIPREVTKIPYKHKNYRYKFKDCRAPGSRTPSGTSLRPSPGDSPNQSLVCDTPECRDSSCSPHAICNAKELEESQMFECTRPAPCALRGKNRPMFPNPTHTATAKPVKKGSSVGMNLGDEDAPCRNCKCSLGPRLSQFKCTSMFCPTKHPRDDSQTNAKPAALQSATTCTEDKSKSCTCLNVKTEQKTIRDIANTTSRLIPSYSDSKVIKTGQSTLLCAIGQLCATVGQLTGQIQLLVTKKPK